MFGIFGKKKPTAADAVVRAIYGDHPPTKAADLERAITIAHEDLLYEQVPASEVRRVASGLSIGPIPYSTHDLSVATALSFFKNPQLLNHLQEVQIGARLRVVDWMKEGKVAPGVVKIFEDTLYRLYKPIEDAADDDLRSKFSASKERNAGKTMRDAVWAVRDLMIWQHNFAECEKPDDPTEAQIDHARRIERAFLIGAAGMAAEGFSLSQSDEVLFLMRVVGTYKGLGPDEAEVEVAQMFDASEAEEEATRIGGSVMIEYLAKGKSEKHRVHLAALQRQCWNL